MICRQAFEIFWQPLLRFSKTANSKVQKPSSQLRFSLPSIIITITSNEPWNRETHKTDRNPPITNQKPWPFEPVKVKFCFLRGPLRWLTAVKNAIVSWLLIYGKRSKPNCRAKGKLFMFLISAFRSYFIFLNLQAYFSLRNSTLASRNYTWRLTILATNILLSENKSSRQQPPTPNFECLAENMSCIVCT